MFPSFGEYISYFKNAPQPKYTSEIDQAGKMTFEAEFAGDP